MPEVKITVLRLTNDAEQNGRCLAACRQQATVHNLMMEHLIKHPDEPILPDATDPAHPGLVAIWARWCNRKPWLRKVPFETWQWGMALARSRYTAWERKEQERERLAAERRAEGRPTPRSVRRARKKRQPLFVGRRRRDRRQENRYRVLGGVTLRERRTLEVPGIGKVRTTEPFPDGRAPWGAVLLQVAARSGGTGRGPVRHRRWELHVDTVPEAAEQVRTAQETKKDEETERSLLKRAEEAAAGRFPHPTEPGTDVGTENGQEPSGDDRDTVGAASEAYRLVQLTPEGLLTTERAGYTHLELARGARAEQPDPEGTAIARVPIAEADFLQIDGEWTSAHRPTLAYGGDHRKVRTEHDPGPQQVEGQKLVATELTDAWLGRAALNVEGNGYLWTGTAVRRVAGYEYQEDGRRLQVWSPAATARWQERTPEAAQPGAETRASLLPVEADERSGWELPPGTGYLLLEAAPSPGGVRNAVPVLHAEIESLQRMPALRAATRQGPFYRYAELTPAGWRKNRPVAFTTLEEAAAHWETGDGTGVILEGDGLEEDVGTIDGRPVAGRGIVGAPSRQRVARHRPGAVGIVRTDESGDGYAYDGHKLVRIRNGNVDEGQDGPVGMPAWIYPVLARACPGPRDRNVRGVLVQLTASDIKRWKLPAYAHLALVMRQGNRTNGVEVQLVTRKGLGAWREQSEHVVPIGTMGEDGTVPPELVGTWSRNGHLENGTDQAEAPPRTETTTGFPAGPPAPPWIGAGDGRATGGTTDRGE